MSQFPLIEKYSKNSWRGNPGDNSHVLKALDTLMNIGDGTIYNVDFQDINSLLNRAAEDVWKAVVSEPFIYNGNAKNLATDEHLLEIDCHVYGLVNIPAAQKKIIKAKLSADSSQLVEAMLSVINEFMPIVEAIKKLKAENRIIKGRKPSMKPAAPVNPDKDIKTCPVCLGQYAVSKQGLMVHHGFLRPGTGYQTRSCDGVSFKPLEVSTDGLVWYISMLEKQIAENKKNLKIAPKLTDIGNPRYDIRDAKRLGEKYKIPMFFIKANTAPEEWNRLLNILISDIKREIEYLNSSLKHRNKILADWKPGKGA
jgi:hypothetical protein